MLSPFFVSRSPIGLFRNSFDDVFNDFFKQETANTGRRSSTNERFPALNIWEANDTYHLEAEIPGVSTETLDVVVVGNELTLKGERKSSPNSGSQGTKIHRKELPHGKFSRVLQFPCEIDAAKVVAEIKNGVLTLLLPKTETAKPRKITIQSGGQ